MWNSLWPNDVIWWLRSCEHLAHLMACCLMTQSHYLNQCWLIIDGSLWHSLKTYFTGSAQDIRSLNEFEKCTSEITCTSLRGQWVNSLAPGKFEWNFIYVILKWILVNDGWGISCEIALIWMSLDFTDDQSTLVQVMAWCCQATSHYLSQCWPRFMSPLGPKCDQLWVSSSCIYHIDRCIYCLASLSSAIPIMCCKSWHSYIGMIQ